MSAESDWNLDSLVTFGAIKVPIRTWNQWSRSALTMSATIQSLKRLQVQLADRQQKMAMERQAICELRETLSGAKSSENERSRLK